MRNPSIFVFMTTTHSRSSLKTSKDLDVEFQRLLKGTFEVIQREFSRMDKEDSSGDSAPIGSSDSETHETKEG